MAEVMNALGKYRFSVDTAAMQSISETHSYRWADHNVAGMKPKSQYVGPDLSVVRFTGTIYPHFRGGLGQTDEMKAEADKGTPLRWVEGTGNDRGLWTIRQLQVEKKELWVKGVPRKIEFSIELKEFAQEQA